MFTCVAGTQRPMDIHLWPYFGRDIPDPYDPILVETSRTIIGPKHNALGF